MLTDLQLNSALTSEQIGDLRTRSLLIGAPDPVDEEIAAAIAKVETSTAGWLISDNLKTGWARDIAAFQVAKRLSKATDDQKTAKDTALKDLEQIRKGEWPNLQPDPAATAPEAPRIRSGSRTAIEPTKV